MRRQKRPFLVSGLATKVEELLEENTQQEKKIAKLEESEATNEKIHKCAKCTFTSNSEQGVKTHVSRKHKQETAESFPQTCNFCETVFKNKKEMRVHLKKHSYNSIDIKAFKYKCSECDFLRENEPTMEVHVSRTHINEVHGNEKENRDVFLEHFKQSRKNSVEDCSLK